MQRLVVIPYDDDSKDRGGLIMLQTLGPIYIEEAILMLLLWPIVYLLFWPVSVLQKHWSPGSITIIQRICSPQYLLLIPGMLFWSVIVSYLISFLS